MKIGIIDKINFYALWCPKVVWAKFF